MIRGILLACLLAVAGPAFAQADSVKGRASVIDGDTIEIHSDRIRLWGIDAPESKQRCSMPDGAEWRCGQQAALALSDFLGARTVICEVRDVDRYKRLVAVCNAGADEINGWMVRQGWAVDYPRYSKGEYADEQGHAANEKLGVWQGTFEMPWDWRKEH